jgi:hypothetical protein
MTPGTEHPETTNRMLIAYLQRICELVRDDSGGLLRMSRQERRLRQIVGQVAREGLFKVDASEVSDA